MSSDPQARGEHDPPLRPPDAEFTDFQKQLGDSSELEESETSARDRKDLDAAGVPGLTAIHGLIRATFFWDLFCRVARSRFNHKTAEARVAALEAAHPAFARFCRVGDYTYRALAALLLLLTLGGVAAGTIFKVFFPHLAP